MPVRAYVGHAGRQKPHEMQRSSSSGVKIPRLPVSAVGLKTQACQG